MRLKVVSALVASALVLAVPSAASGQEDAHPGSDAATYLGISFALTAMLLLILVRDHDRVTPVSP